jgi:hypothetical protein
MNRNSSLKFVVLLMAVFIALKLCGVISWGWLWVLAPLWVPVAFVFAVGLSVLAGAWIKALIKGGATK